MMLASKTDEDIEELVRAYRKKIGLELIKRPDMMTMIVQTKLAFPGFNYRRMTDKKLRDVEAQWDSDQWTLTMRESVFRAMQRGEPHARMTVAHELSHFLLSHEGIRNRSVESKAFERMSRLVRHQESEARRCGPVILAPEYLIPEGADSLEIEEQFGLSPEAALYRQGEIERIRRRARGEQRPLPRNVLDILREAERRGKQLRTRLDD